MMKYHANQTESCNASFHEKSCIQKHDPQYKLVKLRNIDCEARELGRLHQATTHSVNGNWSVSSIVRYRGSRKRFLGYPGILEALQIDLRVTRCLHAVCWA